MINRKINYFFTYMLLAVIFSACSGSGSIYPNSQSKFEVIKIQPNLTKGTSLYFVQPIDKMDLNMSSTWFVDSTGRFNAGDTLSFQHYH